MTNEELLNTALLTPPAHIAAHLAKQPPGARALPTIREAIDVARDGTRIQTTMPGREDVRQSDRMPPGYKPRSAGEMSFDPRLAYEIALDIDDPATVFKRYGYEIDAAVKLSNDDAVFRRTVVAYKEEIKTSGIGFKLKAKIQAEDLLTHSYQIATDPEVPASVRADLIKWTAKVAGYEPRDEAGGGKGGGSFALNVTFAGQAPVTISAAAQKSVAVIEQED